MAPLTFQTLTGSDMVSLIEELAALRIEVFREFPYLYEGSMEYEKRYLQALSGSEQAVLVAAYHARQLVGASTGLPLIDAEDAFQAPFKEHSMDPTRVFYGAESVLRRPYRGQGAGRRFFLERERHARSLNRFDTLCFCAVERDRDHPAKPSGYRSLEPFWKKLGFEHRPELRLEYSWQDLGHDRETRKPMSFWLKTL